MFLMMRLRILETQGSIQAKGRLKRMREKRFKVIVLGMIFYLLNPLILHGGNLELTKRSF